MLPAGTEYVEFVFLPSFERTAEGLLTEEDIRRLEAMLLADPRAGVVIRHTGGVRKVRLGIDGRGKRGATRVVYHYVQVRSKIYLLLVFGKNEQANLTPEQIRSIRRLVAKLEAEG